MRHSEYAFTKVTIEKDTSNITISLSVKNINSHSGGGIANSSWKDTIPIVECIKLDKEKISY